MQKQEAAYTTRINKWFPRVVPHSCPFEVKHTRGAGTFKLKEIKPHQRDFLTAATTKHGMVWKIPDTGFGFNPFDGFVFKNTPAYIIIVYPTNTYAIEINVLQAWESENPTAKVLLEPDAHRLSIYSISNTKLPR